LIHLSRVAVPCLARFGVSRQSSKDASDILLKLDILPEAALVAGSASHPDAFHSVGAGRDTSAMKDGKRSRLPYPLM
jgi:hypothetical protein